MGVDRPSRVEASWLANKKPLWERAPSNQPVSGSPDAISGQSGEENVVRKPSDDKDDTRFSIADDQDVAPVSEFRFSGPEAITVLRSAVSELKSSASAGETTIFGTVTTLHSTENPSDLFSRGTRDLMIEWVSDEYGRRNVRVPLSPEAYLLALDAHRNGARVMISGKLNRGRKGGWRLEEVGKLEII